MDILEPKESMTHRRIILDHYLQTVFISLTVELSGCKLLEKYWDQFETVRFNVLVLSVLRNTSFEMYVNKMSQNYDMNAENIPTDDIPSD